jgi:hypothetical protein
LLGWDRPLIIKYRWISNEMGSDISVQEDMQALEQASTHQNIEPFAQFLSDLVKNAMEGNPVAKI